MSPMFNQARSDAVLISVVEHDGGTAPAEKRYYTGLQVTNDPGVWVVYSGFIAMILGCIVTFFMSHQQVFIQVSSRAGPSRVEISGPASSRAGTSRVEISGTANKHKAGMQRKLELIKKRLAGEADS
jgi:cytochrome c biogenesis protein